MEARDIPMTESIIVRGFRKRTRIKARNESARNVTIASLSVSLPEASGLAFVRSTNLSKFLSAMSFMAQPALRMRNVPNINIPRSFSEGLPSVAMKRDHRVGHRRSSVPYCLGSLIKSLIANSFCVSAWVVIVSKSNFLIGPASYHGSSHQVYSLFQLC